MKKSLLVALCLGLAAITVAAQRNYSQVDPIQPVPTAKQVAWQKLETYAFIHFGLNTFNDKEWGYGNSDVKTFNPKKLDCEQWARTLVAAGMKGVIITAKHHDGFCLWPTRTTDYCIRNTPYKNGEGDVVGELSQACKKYGLKFGVYLSPWDRHQASYGSPYYLKLYQHQLKELLSNYGELFEVWFDGANGGDGWYGGAEESRTIDRRNYYNFPRIFEIVDSLQPNAILFGDGGPGCRWVGNENGFAGETCWSTIPSNTDKNGFSTNLYTLFSEAKKRDESVMAHERGVPFNWYAWNKYVNRHNPEDIISRKDYQELSATDQTQYKGIHNREIRVLFNIDQTMLLLKDKEKYEEVVKANVGANEDKALRSQVNDFIQKMKDNLMAVRKDGSGVAHYDTEKDAVYMPKQENVEQYSDYVQEMLRQVVSATGHQQRLAREGMVMKNGIAPSEDAVKQEKLVVELASGIKMMEMGMPAKISKENMGLVDYWNRELKENPCLIDAIESDVNNALDVIRKAERGEKIEYSSLKNEQQTTEMQLKMPKHYFVADEIAKHPDSEQKFVVIVRDKENKSADVVLPAGASLEVNNEVSGMSKQRIEHALQKEGFQSVKFYNPDGALGYHPDDSYFAGKDITVARLKNWQMEDISKIDVSDAVSQSKQVGFDRIQMVQDDNKRWAMYIKPEGQKAFSIYPDKADLNRFFTTLKQAQDTMDSLRVELAQKYYAMAETKPDLKVDLFGSGQHNEVDMNRIQKVNVFKAKNDVILCAVTIDGADKLQPRVVSPSQWQRMWIAEDKNEYKKHLAATLFADILQKGQTQEQTASEKQVEETEVKQETQVSTDKNEEEHREYHEEENKQASSEEKTDIREEKDATVQRDNNATVEKKEETKGKQKEETKDSPIMKQWKELKAKHPDALLLFRVGDFYEMYEQDAKRGAEVLGITLTKRNTQAGIYMAGFPHHALDTYLPKLIRAGERVAICDQLEAPKQKQEEQNTEEQQRSGGMKR